MTDPEWITVTVRGGWAKHIRRSRITSFGRYSQDSAYIEIDGRLIEVTETEAQLAALLGAQI